jgi:hypothetical protein
MNSIDFVPAWQEAVPRLRESLEQNFTLEGEHKTGRFLIFLYSLRIAASNRAPTAFLNRLLPPEPPAFRKRHDSVVRHLRLASAVDESPNRSLARAFGLEA